MKFETHTFPNGLRLIAAPAATDVAYCGLAVDAGTRDELPTESGMAHFIEHMSFKGTTHRRSWNIINRMESVGGDLNAFTGKEETVYYCTVAAEHYRRALELLTDIVFHSTYPQKEMDREVEVVADEIESYNDSPSELIFDEFDGLLFDGHPLGRNILGDANRLRTYTTADMQAYARRLYQPQRMVLFFLGNVPFAHLVREVDKRIADIPPAETLACPLRQAPEVCASFGRHEVQRDTHQAHVILGAQGFAATDPRHLHLSLLNNILGGPGMNSRLNLALRERNGLVYTVESNSVCYTDTGAWTTYFGCDAHDVNRCLRLVNHELQRLTDAPLTDSALKAAKRQMKGQIQISYDNFENVAIGMGKRLLHYGTTTTKQQLCDRIDALTATELLDTARRVFHPDRLMTLIYE